MKYVDRRDYLPGSPSALTWISKCSNLRQQYQGPGDQHAAEDCVYHICLSFSRAIGKTATWCSRVLSKGTCSVHEKPTSLLQLSHCANSIREA